MLKKSDMELMYLSGAKWRGKGETEKNGKLDGLFRGLYEGRKVNQIDRCQLTFVRSLESHFSSQRVQ